MDTGCRVVPSGEEWAAIVREQAGSHQSAADFCRNHGITYSTFLYHRDKILKKKALVLRQSGAVPAVRSKGFIPITIEGRGGLRLRFPRGLVVESDGLPEASWLMEVVHLWTQEEGSC